MPILSLSYASKIFSIFSKILPDAKIDGDLSSEETFLIGFPGGFRFKL